MKRVLAGGCLVTLLAVAAGAEDITVWQDAGNYVGQERIVEGTVVAVRREGNVIRLAFDPDPGKFTIALIVGFFSNIPADPEHAWAGRTVRARGKIRRFRGVPEMLLRDPTRLIVVGEGTPTAIDRNVDLHERVESLERRLNEIEERLGPPHPPE